MGRLATLVAVLLGALVAAGPLAAAGPARVGCHTGNLTFLFWPQGHNAVGSVGFPAFPYPHMEVYKTAGGRFPNPNEVAIVEFQANGTTGAGFAKSCAAATGGAAGATPAAKVTAASAVVCAFPVPAVLDYAKTGSSITLRALVPTAGKSRVGVSARFANGGTALSYDPAFCKANAAPH